MIDKNQHKLNSILEQLAKNWGIDLEVIDNLVILPIPYKGEAYSVCFSVLDENFALMVLQAKDDISDVGKPALLEILKRNSIINSALSVFFIHENENDKSSNSLPLLYQALFPYSQFSLPDCIKYIESYLNQYSENMKRIDGAEKSVRSSNAQFESYIR